MSLRIIEGMTVLGEYMSSVETVSVQVLVNSGSRDEVESNSGVSHFLEHMAFKGTKRRTAAQIAAEFDMIGGNFNAYTSRESTVYYAKVLKKDLEIAVDILSDILQNSVFDPSEIDKERRVILEELAQTRDTPDDYVFELFQEQLFSGQAIGSSILGSEKFIETAAREDLVDYIGSKYGRNKVVVACAGNFDEKHFADLVEQKFCNLPARSAERVLNAKYTGGEKIVHRDLEQVHILAGFKGVPHSSEQFYHHQLLSVVLGGGMSSRFFQEVREKRGLAYHISAFTSHYQDAGVFAVYSATHDKSVNELIAVVAEQMQLASQNITEEELQRAKAQVISSLLMAQESSSARASRLAASYAIFNRVVPVQEVIARVEELDARDLKESLSAILSNAQSMTVVAIGKTGKMMRVEQMRPLFRA